MAWQMTPFTVPLVLTALLTAAITVPVSKNRDTPVGTPLLGFLLFATVYNLGTALQLSSVSLEGKQFWSLLVAVGRTGTAFTLFFVAAAYTDRRQWLTRERASLVFIIGTSVLLTRLSNPSNVVFSDLTTVTDDGIVFLSADPGPVFFIAFGVAYLFLSVTTYWLVEAYWHAHKGGNVVYSRQTRLIVLSVVVPLALNVLFFLNITRFDLTPFGYAATSALIATALFRYRFLDILPIARGTVVESMDNAVFVLDNTNRVVDINPQAGSTIAVDTDEVVGKQFEEVFADYQPVVEKFGGTTDRRDQVAVYEGDKECHYEVTVSPIEDSLGEEIGRTIVFNNITEQVEREQDLDLMRQVLSRVLRHNIRNELQIVKGNTELLAADLDGTHQTVAKKALDSTDTLISISEKARGIEELVEQDHAIETLDIGNMLEEIVEQYRTEFPSVSFTLDVPRKTVVQATPALHLVFENLIENAAEHNTAAQPNVAVSATENGNEVVVSITDNGPGIPEYELDVLDQDEETDLEHGSGLGLWVVNWVLEDSESSVQYSTAENGTEVTVTLPNRDW